MATTNKAPECPVCFDPLDPPKHIFQCAQGHFLCESCRNNPEMKWCPSCRRPIVGRNIGMEQVLAELIGEPTNIHNRYAEQQEKRKLFSKLHKQLAQLVASKPGSRPDTMEDKAEDPKVQPIVWVSKWVDYSDKYGFGYALTDDSIGIVFNDLTKLLLLSDGLNIRYIDYGSAEHHYTINEFPSSLMKKIQLLNAFRDYMKDLLKGGANMEVKVEDQLSRIPVLKTWFRTCRAVVMQLTNGTIQINFFEDHTKIILCPLLSAVTYIDESRKNRTFRFDLLEKFGCSSELASCLNYAYEMVDTMVNSKSGTGRTQTINSLKSY